MIVHPTYMYTIEGFFYVSEIRRNFVSIIRVNLTVRDETISVSVSFAIKVLPQKLMDSVCFHKNATTFVP